MTDSVKQQEITHHRVLGQQETRQRLLQAAYDTVAHYGYEAASIRHIVERAGFSKGAFFSNFENKESILLELMQKQQQDHLHLLKDSSAISSRFSLASKSLPDNSWTNWLILPLLNL